MSSEHENPSTCHTDNGKVDAVGKADESGRLVEDLWCIKCGYNLRGQLITGSCPECALGVLQTMQRPRIARPNPDWLECLRRGVRWMNRAVWATLYGTVLFAALLSLVSSAPLFNTLGVGVGMAAGIAFALVSVWYFTLNPPQDLLGGSACAACRIAHWLTLPVAASCVWLVYYLIRNGWDRLALSIAAVISPVGVARFFGAMAFSTYCKRVAEIIEKPASALSAKQYRLGFAVSWSLCWPGMLGCLILQNTDTPLCMVFAGGIGLLAFGPLVLALPTYLTAELLEEQDAAWIDLGIDESVAKKLRRDQLQ